MRWVGLGSSERASMACFSLPFLQRDWIKWLVEGRKVRELWWWEEAWIGWWNCLGRKGCCWTVCGVWNVHITRDFHSDLLRKRFLFL